MHDPTEGEFLTGKLLIAMPGIGDERFERAVIYLCRHDEEHAMGLAVNRPVEGLKLPDLLEKLGVDASDAPSARAEPVLVGGPVEVERGFVLHTDDYNSLGATLPIGDGLSLTTSKDVLDALAHDGAPRKALLALGYAGWGPGQLEREVRENVWLVAEPDEALIFDRDHEHKWAKALEVLGINAAALSGSAGRA